jgi:hypothetical protein
MSMKLKWVKPQDFNFAKLKEPKRIYRFYIYWEKKIMEVEYRAGSKCFDFNYGFCGTNLPEKIMYIKTPKEPKEENVLHTKNTDLQNK